MDKPRYLEAPIRDDLAGKMVFVAGPRRARDCGMQIEYV